MGEINFWLKIFLLIMGQVNSFLFRQDFYSCITDTKPSQWPVNSSPSLLRAFEKANMGLDSYRFTYMLSDGYLFKELMRTLIYVFKLVYLLSRLFNCFPIVPWYCSSYFTKSEKPCWYSINNKQTIILSMAFRNICRFFFVHKVLSNLL